MVGLYGTLWYCVVFSSKLMALLFHIVSTELKSSVQERHMDMRKRKRQEKTGKEDGCELMKYGLLYSHIHLCVWGVGWWMSACGEGGSATALTDFQAPSTRPQNPSAPPPPLPSLLLSSPLQRPMPDSTQHPPNKHKLPLFSSTWPCSGCARRFW